jgi:hypothetical protein
MKSLTEDVPLGTPQLMLVPMNAEEALPATIKRLDKVIGNSIDERKQMVTHDTHTPTQRAHSTPNACVLTDFQLSALWCSDGRCPH